MRKRYMINSNDMIRSFLLAVLVLCVSCTEHVAEKAQRELAFSVQAPSLTKGVVSGTALYDDDGDYRPLYVTAYLHAQQGVNQRYVTDEPFTRVSSLWRHTPSLYWPLSGTMDFLTYSVSTPFQNGDIIWGNDNSAERMRIHVGADRTHDDILYGAAWHNTSASYSYTGMTMYHSQAMIEVTAMMKAGSLSLPVTITKAVIKDAYLTGYLNIENNYGHPAHEWDFRSAERRDRIVEDPENMYDTEIPYVAPKRAYMLVPEQPMTTLEIYYTVQGVADKATFDLPHTYWNAGRRYTYSLVFDPVTRASDAGMYRARIELMESEF